MRNSIGDIAHDPCAFEGFLMQQGYAPDRARAIATKGFGGAGYGADDQGIACLVQELKARQERLEQKSALSAILRLSGSWSTWKRLPAVTLSRPGRFKLIVARRSNSIARYPFKGAVFLEVDYVSPTGRKIGQWQSSGNGAGNDFAIAAGMQEISLRGKTSGFDEVKVTFAFR